MSETKVVAMKFETSKSHDPAHRYPTARREPKFRPQDEQRATGIIVRRGTGIRFHRAASHGYKWVEMNCSCYSCKADRTKPQVKEERAT